ncbi:MAG: hypothetical protein ACN6O6_02405 [Pseudomonas sp.]|uniref:hypothetical protein n=1 Tax=Pseudomonas sp. TaxID=306 RepID=UPI003D115E69
MRILALIFLATLSIHTYARDSCEKLGGIATNFAQGAYSIALEDPDMIDKNGLFNTWIGLLGHLLEESEKKGNYTREFFFSAKIAGNSMIENQKDIESKISSSGYASLFSRMVIRTCQTGRASESNDLESPSS